MSDENKSTEVKEWEERAAAEKGEAAPEVGEERVFAVEGNVTDAYVGVDPEYRNYANETDRPYFAEEGVQAEVEKRQLDAQDAINNPVVEDEESEEGNATDTSDGTESTSQSDDGTGTQTSASDSTATGSEDGTEEGTVDAKAAKAKK